VALLEGMLQVGLEAPGIAPSLSSPAVFSGLAPRGCLKPEASSGAMVEGLRIRTEQTFL
jgi:hypothetical protein